MCGIAGVAANSNAAGLEIRAGVKRMCQVLHSRGPDDEGVFISADEAVGLGNRRLAIQDLSPAGHMPMSNPDGTVWITYNGEIYNADELRRELLALGFGFRSHSDTEVILRGYEAWGRDIVGRLGGMFAFAIYDTRAVGRPELLLARDPLGIKPLYYTIRQGVLAFASECRALVAAGFASRTTDAASLLAYLRLGSVPAPLTIYADVLALEAGATLVARREDDCWQLDGPTAAWQPPVRPSHTPQPQTYPEVVEEVRALLLDSIRRHLVSDVPIGAFLSGGLDSGTIVALMREAIPDGVIRTCSVIFQEPEYSEAAYAREVARKFETEHVEVPVSANDLGRQLESIIAALDQPSNDGINTYMVSQAARSASLTVALSGVGGDELFGGYPTFRRIGNLIRFSRWAGAVPGGRRVLARALETRGEHHPAARVGGWMRDGQGSGAAAYLGLRGLFSDREVRHLVSPDVMEAGRPRLDLVGLVERSAGWPSPADGWDAASRYELTCYMRHQLLRDTDVMSMAHSLEVRVPFLDRRVVERVLALDVRTLPGGLPKQILRDISRTLPDSVRLRRDKQGFSFPFQAWLSGPLRPKLEELMQSAEAHFAGYLRPGASAYLLRAFDAGRLHWSRPWAIAALCTAFASSDSKALPAVAPGRATGAASGAENW